MSKPIQCCHQLDEYVDWGLSLIRSFLGGIYIYTYNGRAFNVIFCLNTEIHRLHLGLSTEKFPTDHHNDHHLFHVNIKIRIDQNVSNF